MNKILSAIPLIFGLCASSLATDKNRTVSFPQCEGQEASAVAAGIKRDYLQNLVLRWKDDQAILGQQRPVVWVNLRELANKGDNIITVHLTARGKKADIQYRVRVDCQNGTAIWQRQR
ncbi:protein YebF [Escherichia coli]|uniref:protein YebF n=1 Tax=Escherichia coli TaxID=562 RepID=UPI0028936A75|nr:protein YebF [Escherichia coli]WNK04159.1 protein YebF [Escherichia coli]